MSTITAQQLNPETKAVLNQLEKGESLLNTRNGRPIGRMEPVVAATQPGWNDIMAEVWRVQAEIKDGERVPHSILQERQRWRR